MSYAGLPQDSGIGSSQSPWLRNMMIAQMLMRQGQQPQQGGSPWSSLAGAGGNVVQAMMLDRMMRQGQAQPGMQTPHPPTPLQSPAQGQTSPFPSQPSFASPLGATGQMPGTPGMTNPTFPGGIAPFGTSGTGGIY